MTPRSTRGDLLVAWAILALWCAVVVWLRWGAWAADLSALLIAGWLWEHGLPELIYATPAGFFGGAAAEWAEPMAQMGISGQLTYPYLYPPLWAALIAPLTQNWTIQALMNATLAMQVPLLAGSVLLAGRLAKPEAWRWSLWALWGVAVLSLTAPAFLALTHTQPTILMGFVILLAFERLAAGKPAIFGALIALAAAIKLSPAVLVLAAVALVPPGRDRLRAGGAFLAFGAALALASIGLTGWTTHRAMLDSVGAVSAQSLMIALNLSAQSVAAQFWLDPATLPAAGPTPAILALASRVVAVVALASVLWRARSWPAKPRYAGVLLGLSLVIWFLGPLGWLHYFVLPLLILPGLTGVMPMRRAIIVGSVVAAVSSMPVYLAISLLPGFHALYPALAGAAWLAVLTALLWPQDRSSSPPR